MIVFAAGNKYKIEAETLELHPNGEYYAFGIRWVKSKQAWASDRVMIKFFNMNAASVWDGEKFVEVKD